MAAYTDPFRNPTSIIPRVRTTILTGGAAGDHTLTGIDLEYDSLISVNSIASVGATHVTGFAAGTYTMDADDATASSATIPTGLTAPDTFQVMVLTAGGNVVITDADITISGANLVVADGAATFAVTDTYVVHWMAWDASDASLSADVGTLSGAELTSEFTLSADDTINNDSGTATVGDVLVVVWFDHNWGETAKAPWQ